MAEKFDYEKLGFKAGLEIHQQLDSSKLFCSCPSVLRNDMHSFETRRKLHPIAGESGTVDDAVKYEKSLDKEFIYQSYDTTCLIELDEEPPHEINQEALEIASQISLLLNCKLIPLTQIMRKTVINGSNTSGFQRTVLIARDGFVETSFGKVGIDYVFLEEDSARPIEKTDKKVVYRLDRLGIPLVEIATKPDMKNAVQVKETALLIGEILRSCKVRRGIGTIRQDLNVSIKDSNRVEIKGFQDSKIMEDCVRLEVIRQKEILDSGKINPSEVRDCLADGATKFLRPLPGKSRMYPETDLPLLKLSKDFMSSVKKNLPKLISEEKEILRKQGLTEEMIKIIFKRNKLNDYKELYSVIGNPILIGKALLLIPKEISSKKKRDLFEVEEILNVEKLIFVLEKIYKDKLHEADLKLVLERIVEGIDLKESVKIERMDISEIEEKVLNLIKSKPGLNANAYMGLVMKEFSGAVSGAEAMRIIKKFI